MKCLVFKVSVPLLVQEFSLTFGCQVPLRALASFRSRELVMALFLLPPQLFIKLLRTSQLYESFILPVVCRETSWGRVGRPGNKASFLSFNSAQSPEMLLLWEKHQKRDRTSEG